MRHHVTLLASLAAVVAGLAIAVNVHSAAVKHQLVLDAQNAAVHARQVAQEQAQAHANAVKVQNLEVSCINGEIAYSLLTPAQRDHVVKPNCSQ